MTTCGSTGAKSKRLHSGMPRAREQGMRGVFEPFAVMLYRRHREGETIAELAAAFGIPEDRVEARIRAAATHLEREKTRSGLAALSEHLSRQ